MKINGTAVKIGILGAGAIGQLLHWQFISSNVPIVLIARQKPDKQKLTFTSLTKKTSEINANIIDISSTKPNINNLKLLIVCVKAYQVKKALESVIPHLKKDCHILLLHNGMIDHKQIIKLIAPRGLSLATTAQSSLKKTSWHTIQTGTGITQFGHFCGRKLALEIKNQFLQAIPHSHCHKDILFCLWEKLAINAVINPLTAIYQCKNGNLVHPQYNKVINGLLTEIIAVAKANDICLSTEKTAKRIYQVIALTAENYSSMHQDIANHHPTEIDAINGYIVKLGEKYRIKTPINAEMLNQVNYLSGIDRYNM